MPAALPESRVIPDQSGDLFALQLRVARRADELSRNDFGAARSDFARWFVAEQEVFSSYEPGAD